VAAACAACGAEVAGWSAAPARGGGLPTVPPQRRRARMGTRGMGHVAGAGIDGLVASGPDRRRAVLCSGPGPVSLFQKSKYFPIAFK
jgi:hypothetical protein